MVGLDMKDVHVIMQTGVDGEIEYFLGCSDSFLNIYTFLVLEWSNFEGTCDGQTYSFVNPNGLTPSPTIRQLMLHGNSCIYKIQFIMYHHT